MPSSYPAERIFKQCIGTDIPGCLWIPIGRTVALSPIPVSPQCSGGIHGGRVFAYGENSHALRLTSELGWQDGGKPPIRPQNAMRFAQRRTLAVKHRHLQAKSARLFTYAAAMRLRRFGAAAPTK